MSKYHGLEGGTGDSGWTPPPPMEDYRKSKAVAAEMQMVGRPSGQKPPAEIPDRLNQLGENIGRLTDLVSKLAARLVPVCSIRPSGEDKCSSRPSVTTLGGEVAEMAAQVSRVSAMVTEIHESLEL